MSFVPLMSFASFMSFMSFMSFVSFVSFVSFMSFVSNVSNEVLPPLLMFRKVGWSAKKDSILTCKLFGHQQQKLRTRKQCELTLMISSYEINLFKTYWQEIENDDKARVSGRYFFHRNEVNYFQAANDPVVQEKFLGLCEQISGLAFPTG